MKSRNHRGARHGAALAGVVLAAGAVIASLGAPPAAAAPSAADAAKRCPNGRPGLAVQVGWKTFDTFFYAMQTHVQVANCKSQVKAVRIVIMSLRAEGAGLVEQDAVIRGTYPSKYGNTAMMIHVNKFLRAIYTEPPSSGAVKGIVLDDKKSFNNLMSCTQLMDATPINTNEYRFTVRVEPLDSRLRVIRSVGAASLGPFACGQPAGTS